jgi:hypothetical protein
MLEALSGVYLSPRYDNAQPTPDFHREVWVDYCSDVLAAAVAAPRNHAKTTGLTYDYVIGNAVFRVEPYIIILGATEEAAVEFLTNIALEFRENEPLIRDFRIKGFIQDQKTDIIVECTDGYQFRILARGAEQKIRGRIWRGRRPGLVVADDIEDDEMVESKDRRRKFIHWILRAAKQSLRDGGKFRMHGTILHEDSALAKLIKLWKGKIYKAHRSFDEFQDILWPEKFSEERLRSIRQEFVDNLDSGGYSQEYLNDPFDSDTVYLRKEDLIPMSEEDREKPKIYCAAADFAISTLDSANRTCFTVGGKDVDNLVHKVDNRVGRWDALRIIEEIFLVAQRWKLEIFWVEDGQIWKAIWPMIREEMRKRDEWIHFLPVASTKDKAVRGRSFQKRTQAGGFRVDKETSWYVPWEVEVLRFTGVTEATLDDQFDADSLLCRGFEDFYDVEKEDLETEEEREVRELGQRFEHDSGRSSQTGY